MAKTVISAFNEFLKDKVNLDSDISKAARTSRDWLINQIHNFTDKDDEFPTFYQEKDIFFGSFARKTKKRELDDIDIMVCLHGQGSTYYEYSDRFEITVPDSATNLKKLCNDNTNILNSKKVINKFIANLKNIGQYRKAEIHRNQQAATLNLISYDWNFDIVPCFFTTEDSLRKTYYIIPDGNGNWMKTDPRIDQQKVSDINQNHSGNVLNVIRIIKYWNKRPTMPSMQSYLLENMILNYYNTAYSCSEYVDVEIPNVLLYISTAVYCSVDDPKGIQGNLNNLSYDDIKKISARASSDYLKAVDARNYENNKDDESSINKWKELFGGDFPEYDGE